MVGGTSIPIEAVEQPSRKQQSPIASSSITLTHTHMHGAAGDEGKSGGGNDMIPMFDRD